MKEIIVSRTDAIGDVVLTLPLCGILKKHFPNTKITFLGQSYTQAVIETCKHIDAFIDIKSLPKYIPQADTIIHVFPRKDVLKWAYLHKIPKRICTYSRIYAWIYANTLVKLHRKSSDLHEAQLNLKLLKPLGINTEYSLQEINQYYGITKIPPLPDFVQNLINSNKQNWIIHPTSQGSAREWGLHKYKQLIENLNPEQYNIFITGTEKDKSFLTEWIKNLPPYIHDLTGRLTLHDLIALIYHTDGLVAGSTGPLHIAAAIGKKVVGIYPSIRPMHPQRWQPLGIQAQYVSVEKDCTDCKKTPKNCVCLQSIEYTAVFQKMNVL
jgi:ADP-heptose:LPS heptosyltransferase